MREFRVKVDVDMKIDAPNQEEADCYGEVFVKKAMAKLCDEHVPPCRALAQETGIARFDDSSDLKYWCSIATPDNQVFESVQAAYEYCLASADPRRTLMLVVVANMELDEMGFASELLQRFA